MKRILSLLAVFLTVVSVTFADDGNLLTGKFSVSALKQVQFTKGNLYYNSTSATYSIAENQTDFETTWDASKVDHFYWSKTASVAYLKDIKYAAYYADDELFCGQLTPLTIGGEQLYALMGTEWTYLFTERPNADKLINWDVTVTNGGTTYNHCVIIAPDDFSGTLKDSYTLTEVNSAGLVCLPAAGYRYSDTFTNTDGNGNYSVNTPNGESNNGAQYISTNDKKVKTDNKTNRNWQGGVAQAYTIRLVKTVAVTPIYSGTTATVGTLADLKTALGKSSVKTIIVTEAIQLPTGTTLDGQGKTIQVQTPYCTAVGTVDTNHDWYNVFTINGGSVTLKNMTVYGGYYGDIYSAGGIRVISEGVLNLENVTIARCGRGLYVGYGNSATTRSKAVLKNCRIVRNIAPYGGGILNIGTTLMDGCSFSENRSTRTGGGGGALENKSGTMYANNTVIANNCSSYFGGAINNNQGTLYLMNCTVSGNVTTNSVNCGGGLGNILGTIYAVNTIFMNNYYIYGTTVTSSDIGHQTNQQGTVKLFNCLYGSIQNGTPTTTDCIKASDDAKVFASYRTDGILSGESGTTNGFKHSILTHISDDMFALYAPAGTDNNNTGGVVTYFDYDNSLSSVKMSCGSSNTALGSLSAASTKVATYYEGGTRETKQIGASAYTSTKYFTVKLSAAPSESEGTVTGVTTYGDTYVENTEVTMTATPNDGYKLSKWMDADGTTVLSTANPYTFAVTSDVTLYPVFEKIKLVFNESAVTTSDLTAAKNIKAIVTIERTFYKDGGNNTICLPFALDETALAASPLAGYTKLQEFSTATIVNKGTNNETLELTMTNATAIEAGKPYIIAWDNGDNLVNPVFEDVRITTYEPSMSAKSNGVQFCGTLIPYAMTKDDKGHLFVGTGGELHWPNVSNNLRGFRSYFTVDLSAGAKFGMSAFLVDDDDDMATDVSTLSTGSDTAKAKKLIEAGKVVIISNGKHYGLNGVEIKD